MTTADSHDAVLPLKDGTYVRLRDAQAVVGQLLAKVPRGQQRGSKDYQAEEVMRLLDDLEREARPTRAGDRIRDGAAGQIAFLKLILQFGQKLQLTLTVTCIRCGRQLSVDRDDARLQLTADGEPVFYCAGCWQAELGRRADCSAT